MSRFAVKPDSFGVLCGPLANRSLVIKFWRAGIPLIALAATCGIITLATSVRAVVLWSDLGETLVHDTGAGSSFLTSSAMDILGGAVRENNSSTNTLYFKFHVDPLSDVNTEEYFAGFELYEGDTERLAIGNSRKAWAYSAFNTDDTGAANKVFGDVDLNSSAPEPSALGKSLNYEFPRRGVERTIVFKVQYVPGGKDKVTVWLNPDLSPGATEAIQSESLITKFTANASFNQIRLRHGGGGGGWTFGDMAIATSFNDFVASGGIESAESNHASNRGPLSYTIQNWQREQGLPQNSVRALAQARDGYIWVGNDDGVARFDGIRFVSFGMREGLNSFPVSTLLADSHGRLWIGSVSAGLGLWQNGHVTTYNAENGLPDNGIMALAEDNTGGIWIGTAAGLVVWRDGHLTRVKNDQVIKGLPVTALFTDRNGDVWVGATGAGVFHYRDGKFVPVTDPSVQWLLQDPHCLLVDQGGRLWVGAGDDFVLCHDGDQWHRYRIPHHLARPYISALAEEPDGTVWAGSVSEGLFQFRGGKLAAFDASSGLSDNLVECLLVDRQGELWVGTDTGLNRLRRRSLFVLGQNEGLGYGAVQGLAEVERGVIWACKSDGLYSWEGRRFNRLPVSDIAGATIQPHAVLADRNGSCWVGGEHGLFHFQNPKTPQTVTRPTALAGLSVISLAQDEDGSLWAGTDKGGLWRQTHGRWIAQTNFAQPHAITVIVPVKDNGVWIGTEGGGLYQFNGKVRDHYTKGSGLLSDVIRTLYLDADGTLWIGTGGGGLGRLKHGRMTTYTVREGLPDNTVSQILEDSVNRLWLGGNHGIARVTERELDDLVQGKISAVYPKVYGLEEGMVSDECTGGFCPAGLKARSGLLWFSTAKGIVVTDARPRSSDMMAPRAILEEVLLDGAPDPEFRGPDSTDFQPNEGTGTGNSEVQTLHIPPGQHRLELRYTGLSFEAPDRIRFRYRLEGLDQEWVEAGTRRVAFYSFVPSGTHRFRVIACNNDGVWDENGASVEFAVSGYFWQSWWVITLASLGLLISVGGTIRIVERRRLHHRLVHLEQERTLQRERERIARDLHDDLGSSLARISLLSGLAKADKDHPDQVELHVDKIAHSADQTVRALEEIVWAVRPGSDSLQSLVEYITHFANELFEDDRTRCRLDLPHDLPACSLPPDMRHNIFLVVKEALTNAFKHAAATEVQLQAKVTRRTLEILVQDNGKGFDPAILPTEGKRNGLRNMRRRAEATNGKLTVQSEPEKGTTVRFVVNLPNDSNTGNA